MIAQRSVLGFSIALVMETPWSLQSEVRPSGAVASASVGRSTDVETGDHPPACNDSQDAIIGNLAASQTHTTRLSQAADNDLKFKISLSCPGLSHGCPV